MRSPSGAAPASASGSSAPATGSAIFVDGRLAGEINLSAVQRGPFQSAYVGYWIDEEHAGNGYVPEALVVLARFAFEELRLHRMQIAIIPRNKAEPPGRREARPPRGGRGRALPRDQRRVGGPRPLRDDRRGVGRAS